MPPLRFACKLAAAAATSAALAGCAVLFVSTDGLSGAADDVAEGGRTDAAVALDGEGGGAKDAGADGAQSADGATLGYCASNPGHTFCDDFDDRDDVSVGWESDQGGRCLGGSDVTRSKSAPRSARAYIPAGDSVASYAHIARSFGTTTRLRVAFDILITPPSGSVGDSLGTVNFPQGYFDIVWYTSGAVTITERTSDPNVDHVSATPLPSGKWVRVEIEVTPGHIRCTIDGQPAVDAATPVTYQGEAKLHLGLFAEDTMSIAANYDNVLVDTSF